VHTADNFLLVREKNVDTPKNSYKCQDIQGRETGSNALRHEKSKKEEMGLSLFSRRLEFFFVFTPSLYPIIQPGQERHSEDPMQGLVCCFSRIFLMRLPVPGK